MFATREEDYGFSRLPAILSASLTAMAELALEPTPTAEEGVELLHRLSGAAAGSRVAERVAVSR